MFIWLLEKWVQKKEQEEKIKKIDEDFEEVEKAYKRAKREDPSNVAKLTKKYTYLGSKLDGQRRKRRKSLIKARVHKKYSPSLIREQREYWDRKWKKILKEARSGKN